MEMVVKSLRQKKTFIYQQYLFYGYGLLEVCLKMRKLYSVFLSFLLVFAIFGVYEVEAAPEAYQFENQIKSNN